MNNELDKYYELLGVAPGASAQELKDAYRDLAKVWHPDRFSHDARLQKKAQDKLKEINEAYDQLTSAKAGRRTHSAPTPAKPPAPSAMNVRRRRPRLVLLTAVVFCGVFLAALSSLVSSDTRPAPDTTTPVEREEAQTSDNVQQPASATRTATGQPTRAKERMSLHSATEAMSVGDADSRTSAPEPRPMSTVTVTIDTATGQLATRDCPTLSRMTYPAGAEPRQHCTAQHKTRADPQSSRLKSVGKRLAAPAKWLGGGKGTDTQVAQPPGSDGPEDK